MRPGGLDPQIRRHCWQNINRPRRSRLDDPGGLTRRLDEQRHHADFECIDVDYATTRSVCAKAGPMISGHHQDGLVEDPHMFEPIEELPEQTIDVLDLKQMPLIALLS